MIESRQHHKNDKYLLQEKIVPVRFGSRKAWFRVFYVCGTIIPCWWDDETHIYETITKAEVRECGFGHSSRSQERFGRSAGWSFFQRRWQ